MYFLSTHTNQLNPRTDMFSFQDKSILLRKCQDRQLLYTLTFEYQCNVHNRGLAVINLLHKDKVWLHLINRSTHHYYVLQITDDFIPRQHTR